mmetsp:Transcript_18436/g.39613  ORF Transcript_18436/g.39613 Transcript_18436/m.39613 type:complete len:288 (+) Transcript_18436:156-1019(+)
MERKAPPQAMAEEDSKLPAAATPQDNPSKRRKINTNKALSAMEVVDVAAELSFQPGDRIEVKWTINDDDSEEEGQENNELKGKAENGENAKCISVWWPATLCGKTDEMHTLSYEERQESEVAHDLTPDVKVPIYKLNYAPLEEHGFETHSLEDVAFISNQTLLNLSTDEMMTFRKVGEPSPPSSPSPNEEEIAKVDESAISREFDGQDEVGSFMNQLMQQCLKNTGMDEKMKSLPKSQQLIMAERIQKAKDGFLGKMMEETDKMGPGNKIITADVVRRCMAQMKEGY